MKLNAITIAMALAAFAAFGHEYPTNPDPSHVEFFGKLGRDSLVVTNVPHQVEVDPTVIPAAKSEDAFATAVTGAVSATSIATNAWRVMGTDAARFPTSYVFWETDDRSYPDQWVWCEKADGSGYHRTSVTNRDATFIPLANNTGSWVSRLKLSNLYAVRQKTGPVSSLGFASSADALTREEANIIVENEREASITNAVKAAKAAGDSTYLCFNPISSKREQYIDSPSQYSTSLIGIRNNNATGTPRSTLDTTSLRFYRSFGQVGLVYSYYPNDNILQLFFSASHDGKDLSFEFPMDKPAGDYTFATFDDIPPPADFSPANTQLVGTVTHVVREELGGYWDEELGVWWSGRMSNGKLTYQATTNVNLNAEH